MTTKTISLDMDAYEKLKQAKKSGESFSQVVKRAWFLGEAPKGELLREYYRNGGSGVSEAYLSAVETSKKSDPHPENPWD